MLVRCPSCRMSVWVKEDLQCPSCRKQIPASAVPAAPAGAAPASPPQAASRPAAAAAASPQAVGIPASAFAAQSAKPRLPTARRTSWAAIVFGLLFVLFGVLFLTITPPEGGGPQVRMGRRARALESLLGETGVQILGSLMFIGIGVYMIATCRRDVLLAAAPASGKSPAAPGVCDFCRQTSPDATGAFLTIDGGRPPNAYWVALIVGFWYLLFRREEIKKSQPVAFRCRACESCRRKSRDLAARTVLMAPLLFVGGLLVFLSVIMMPMALLNSDELKPGAGKFAAWMFGSTVAVVAVLAYMHWQIRRRTVSLLGQLEPVVRSAAGVKKWGWPRRPAIRREHASGLPVIELTQ